MPDRAFVDTDVFLRFLTDDVPAQADAVASLLRRAADGELELVTNDVTIAEIVWTLESHYELEREQIRDSVLAILNTPGLEVIDAEVVLEAITWYVEGHPLGPQVIENSEISDQIQPKSLIRFSRNRRSNSAEMSDPGK